VVVLVLKKDILARFIFSLRVCLCLRKGIFIICTQTLKKPKMDSNSLMMSQSLFEYEEEEDYTEYSFYDDGLSVIMEETSLDLMSQCSSFIDDRSDSLGFPNRSKSDQTFNTCNTSSHSNSDGLELDSDDLLSFDRSFGEDEWIEVLEEGSRPKQRPNRDLVAFLRTGEKVDMFQDSCVSFDSSASDFSLLEHDFTEEDIRILEEECGSSSERDEEQESMKRRPAQQEHSQEMIESSQRKQNYLESLKLLKGMMKRNKESKKKAERFSGLERKENYKVSKRCFEEMKQLPNADMRSLLIHRRHNARRLRFKLFRSKLLKKIPQTMEQEGTDIPNKRSQKWHESRPTRKITSVKSNMRNSQRPDTPLPATKRTIMALPVFKLDLDLDLDLANTSPLLPSIAMVGDSYATAEPSTIKSEASKPSPFSRRERQRACIRDKMQRLESSILQLQLLLR
jgi:hypothetical protein